VSWFGGVLLGSVVAFAAVLAGCSSPADNSTPPTSSDHPDPGLPGENATQVIHSYRAGGWTTDGSTPYGTWVCDGAVTHQCPAAAEPADAWGWQNRHDAPAGNVTSGNVTLSWTAASQLTQSLALGVTVDVKGCGDCLRIEFGPDISGPSPLVFPIPVGTALPANAEFHVWVYGGTYQSAGPETVGTSGQQDFSLTGAVAVVQ